jgi:hypothetical protein
VLLIPVAKFATSILRAWGNWFMKKTKVENLVTLTLLTWYSRCKVWV